MTGWIIALSLIALIVIWIRIDLRYGKKKWASPLPPDAKKRYGELELLASGDVFFHRLFHDLKQAEDHIHFLFYIIRDDYIGKKLLEILEDKAKEGVTVRILVDRIGSELSRKARKRLKKAGVSFAYSHRPAFPFFWTTLNRRNHRKIVVIDGKIGYLGGYNIGDEYLGRDVTIGFWRDFHLRLEHDGVQDLQRQFLKDWQRAKKTYTPRPSYYPPLKRGCTLINIHPSDGAHIEETFQRFIKQAKKNIYLGTPYYIPSKSLQQELIAAAKRGVDVKLIVPKKADHPFVGAAASAYFYDLLDAGVEIYQYYRGFYHAKALVVDDDFCDIGTANFDKRSLYINSEINCLIYDPDFVSTVVRELKHDISISSRLTLSSLKKRSIVKKGKEKLALLVSDLL